MADAPIGNIDLTNILILWDKFGPLENKAPDKGPYFFKKKDDGLVEGPKRNVVVKIKFKVQGSRL
jgi:hypothetical protein